MDALLEARGLRKRYGHVEALRGADFSVAAGEVVALIGDNGAGKSTLVKCLAGALRPDEGTLLLEGREVAFGSPVEARRAGIETVYQDLALAPDLTPAANLYLGREPLRGGFLGRLRVLDRERMRCGAAQAFDELGICIEHQDEPVGAMSGGQRQCVAVARAAAWASKVVFMDEPTAALGVVQRERVLELIRRVRDAGRAVVLISHNLPEVQAVADRIEVLRLGRRVARCDARSTPVEELVAAMTGARAEELA